MRFYRLASSLLLILIAGAAHVRADSVTLNTGEKITGSIRSETDTEVTIDVPVSASITDTRVLQKSEVTKIDKEEADEIEYRQLIGIQPNPQLSYSADTYDKILAAFTGFETKYPASPYLAELKKLKEIFTDEKKKVDAGQVKYLGRWLGKEEAAKRQVQIAAMGYLSSMQQQAGAGNLIGALQTFDYIEKNYSITRSYPPAVQLAQQVIPRFQQELTARMQQVKTDQQQLKQTIAFAAEPQKSSIIEAARTEQERATSAVQSAIASGQRWAPLIPRSQISIDTLQKTATAEVSRVNAIQVAPMMNSITKVDQARVAMDAGDFKQATTLLADATTLWPKNEAAAYWKDRLKEKMAQPVATSTPKVIASTPKPTPRPVAAVTAAPAPPEEKPFYMTLQGAIAIAAGVLVVGGAAAAFRKRQASKAVQ